MQPISIAMTVFTILGTCLLGVSVIPQVLFTMKTKKTSKLSLMLYLVLMIATLFLLIYGVGLVIIPAGISVAGATITNAEWLWSYRIPGIAIIVCEIICFSSSFIVTFVKLRNIYQAKKLKISEEEFENNQGKK